MGFLSSVLGGVGGFLVGGPVGGLVGAGLGYASDKASSQAQSNYNQQMSFAQSQAQFQQDYARNVMQWRVDDAKKAGVHPMAALGVSNPSYSPVSSPSAPAPTDYNALFDTATTFGQNLNRASFQAKTQQQQLAAIGLVNRNMELQNKGLEQEQYWRGLQIGQLESNIRNGIASSNPAPTLDGRLPGVIEGQNDSDVDPKALVDPKAMRTTPHKEPGKEPGSNPSTGWIQNPDGSVTAVQSESAKERLEEDLIGSSIWALNNRVLPHAKTMFGLPAGVSAPPDDLLPKGAVRWMYNGYGSFIPVDSHGKRVGGPPQVNSDKTLKKYVRDFPKRHFGRFGIKY